MRCSSTGTAWGAPTRRPGRFRPPERAYHLAGDQSADVDHQPVYPAAWDLPGLISVANVDQGAKVALSSNYGFKTITMVAPGVNVFSTLPGGFVGRMTGTAQAAAHVAGAAALMKSMHHR